MMKRNMRLLYGIVTALIGFLLVHTQGTGGYVLVGFGLGYLGSTFCSEKKMAKVVENSLNQSELFFFRVFELLSICLIFMEGYAIIGMFVLLSLISIEWLNRRKKVVKPL